MNFLIIGLGSMGRRRIRCLQSLEHKDIYGFDKNIKRIQNAEKDYGIKKVNNVIEFLKVKKVDAIIISTSPESHSEYIKIGIDFSINCFVEASVTDKENIKEFSKIANKKNIFIAPSCTKTYFPAPKLIKKILEENNFGELFYFNYSTGQYLPDWHPWEDINDYYVSKTETGGCREIVPFELTWLNKLFGKPKILNCIKRRTGVINAPIDDYYNFVLEYPKNLIGNIIVEVLSRPNAHSDFRITGSNGQLKYDQENNIINFSLINGIKTSINISEGEKEPGYIHPEGPYISEINDFIKALENKNKSLFPNNLEYDYEVLNYLSDLEKISQ